MKKVTTLVLMLCLILSGALCHASGVARTENEKGESFGVMLFCSGSEKTIDNPIDNEG